MLSLLPRNFSFVYGGVMISPPPKELNLSIPAGL